MKKAIIKISGSDCSSDAFNIEKSLLDVNGVKNVRISSLLNLIFADCEIWVNKKDLNKAIEKLGYKIEEVTFEDKNEKS